MKMQTTTSKAIVLFSFLFLSWNFNAFSQTTEHDKANMPKLENPVTVQYLKQHLRKKSPRLVLTPALVRDLRKKVKTDPVVRNMYEAIKLNASEIQKQPLLERVMVGRRLLGTSREMLYRMNILGIVYVIEKNPAILKRINDEVTAVCNFTDWNPSHFLDVAEMSMAVAIAVDWTAGNLPQPTIDLAKTSLIEKGIKPSYAEKGMGWIKGKNNWNQVCNGGMIAASLAVAEKDPELAAKTIHRSLDGMPYALVEYSPDGVYPEGSTYWGYGTGFSVLTSSMLQSAFGTDFGLAAYPAFIESAKFKVLSIAPSGWYFNYSDCGDKRGEDGDLTLAWFATKTGNAAFFEKDRFMMPPEKMGKLSRNAGAGLVWLSEYKQTNDEKMPLAWKGDGDNPIVIIRGGNDDPHQYYLGAKGGKGTNSHGNLDAGSFVFEVNGVRWGIDPGNQDYNTLEKTGFDLWGNCQECQRWTLLTKNNFGHSTITVNNALFKVDGFAPITDFEKGDQPEATIDLSAVYGGNLKSAQRQFVKDGPQSLLIEDDLVLDDATKMVTWQMMTTADVTPVKGGAVLKQDGKTLNLAIQAPQHVQVSVISLDPPPLKLDRQIDNLKRIEIRMPAYIFQDGKGKIAVRLSGD